MNTLLWPVALPLACLYGVLVRLRLLAYRHGWLKSRSLGGPTIAVGNLTAGGTGKTPVVSWILGEATALGRSTACLTRGYGRRSQSTFARICVAEGAVADPVGIGDEAAMLAMTHPAVKFFVGANRVEAAKIAQVTDRPDLYVLDDAFQHVRARRDLNVLLVDAQAGFGNARLLPLGPLREPVSGVHRADVILVTKANLGDANGTIAMLQRLNVRAPIYRCDYHVTQVRRLDGNEVMPAAALTGKRVGLLCGIARPEAFRRTAEELGATVTHMEIRRDHHPYPPADVDNIRSMVSSASSVTTGPSDLLWLTTEKDAVKLHTALPSEAQSQIWVLTMEAVPEPAARAFFLDRLRALKLK